MGSGIADRVGVRVRFEVRAVGFGFPIVLASVYNKPLDRGVENMETAKNWRRKIT